MIALPHTYAGVVDVQAIDPSCNPGRDGSNCGLVIVDLADHSDRASDVLAANLFRDDARQRFGRWGHHQLSRIVIAAPGHLDQVHPTDRTGSKVWELDLGVHGARPKCRIGLLLFAVDVLLGGARIRGRAPADG